MSQQSASDDPYSAAKVARQAKWFTLSKIGIAVIALLTQFVLVRHLSVLDYAGYTVFIGSVAVLVFFTMYGMDRVVYRFIPPLRAANLWREMSYFMAGMMLLRMLSIVLLICLVWFALRPLMSAQLVAQLEAIPWQCLVYALALGGTDSFPVFCNALGQQGRQSLLLMFTTCLRMLLILGFLWQGDLSLTQVAWMMAGTEVLLAVLLKLVILREILQLRRAHPIQAGQKLQFGFRVANVLRDSLSTQMAYSVALPFRGSFLRLIIASVASPVVVASFGFFQTMADRAYQFMPMFLMKGMLEPALASDYAKHQDGSRIRLTVSLLLRINALILALAFAVLFGCGEQLINLLTNGRYGSEVYLAALILLQLAAMTLGEALWISLNPIGRIHYHNRIWTGFALLCYGLLALATWLKNPLLLVAISALPYCLVYVWLRFVSREASMQSGFDIPRMARLILPMAAAFAAARATLLLPASTWVSLLALCLAVFAFALLLRPIKLFQAAEVQAVAGLSPKLARILRLLS